MSTPPSFNQMASMGPRQCQPSGSLGLPSSSKDIATMDPMKSRNHNVLIKDNCPRFPVATQYAAENMLDWVRINLALRLRISSTVCPVVVGYDPIIARFRQVAKRQKGANANGTNPPCNRPMPTAANGNNQPAATASNRSATAPFGVRLPSM